MGVDNMRCNPQSKNVVFHIRDLSYANFIIWDQDCTNLIGVSAVELMNKMIEDEEDDPKCFPEDLDVLLGCTLAFKIKDSNGEGTCDSSTEANSKGRPEIEKGKKSFGVPICDSNNEAETTIKESSPIGLCGSSTQSKTVGLIKSGAHAKKIKEFSPIVICGSSTQSKTVGSIKSATYTGKIKESSGKTSCDENTEADICM
ncbi:hypothetical protein DEO72_LG7g1820 [Vigna unguiculata]|uniref:Nucleic acid-binding n=1 Tax=Vigna unguiculata TaxID=3917 RepID=A0A4D6MGF0_VIGUN|nr:hypothetical protein DEO72_LG7g1820 [Vigna unguiculata]